MWTWWVVVALAIWRTETLWLLMWQLFQKNNRQRFEKCLVTVWSKKNKQNPYRIYFIFQQQLIFVRLHGKFWTIYVYHVSENLTILLPGIHNEFFGRMKLVYICCFIFFYGYADQMLCTLNYWNISKFVFSYLWFIYFLVYYFLFT